MMAETGLKHGILYGAVDGEELKPLGQLEETTLTESTDGSDIELKKRYFSKEFTCTGTIKCNWWALMIFFMTGNKLFVKFPKKVKRSRKWRGMIKYWNGRRMQHG